MIEGQLIGHVFAPKWIFEGRRVVWVIQLVVRSDWRRKRVATAMLVKLRCIAKDEQSLRGEEGAKRPAVGILSSNPAALKAAITAFKGDVRSLNEDFLSGSAKTTMASSPVRYVRDASGKLKGRCFENGRAEGPGDAGEMCCADTEFFSDHSWVERVLESMGEGQWPFGRMLPEGCEFLALFKVGEY